LAEAGVTGGYGIGSHHEPSLGDIPIRPREQAYLCAGAKIEPDIDDAAAKKNGPSAAESVREIIANLETILTPRRMRLNGLALDIGDDPDIEDLQVVIAEVANAKIGIDVLFRFWLGDLYNGLPNRQRRPRFMAACGGADSLFARHVYNVAAKAGHVALKISPALRNQFQSARWWLFDEIAGQPPEVQLQVLVKYAGRHVSRAKVRAILAAYDHTGADDGIDKQFKGINDRHDLTGENNEGCVSLTITLSVRIARRFEDHASAAGLTVNEFINRLAETLPVAPYRPPMQAVELDPCDSLYRLIGRTVDTPGGPGQLLQVFHTRATVHHPGAARAKFYDPEMIVAR
jgi:hypothetical protein